jgi:hypothetical protein
VDAEPSGCSVFANSEYTPESLVGAAIYAICNLHKTLKSEADSDNLPAPCVIAQKAALEQFKLIAGDLGSDVIEEA